MNELQGRQPGQISRIHNQRPKIHNGDDGNTNIILPGQTNYANNSRNKGGSRQNTQAAATVGNISDLPYNNLEIKNRQSQSRNGGVTGANTHTGLNVYNVQDKGKKAIKMTSTGHMSKTKYA